MKTDYIKTDKHEIRYVKSQKFGWVSVQFGDRDWIYSVSEAVMYKRMTMEDALSLCK